MGTGDRRGKWDGGNHHNDFLRPLFPALAGLRRANASGELRLRGPTPEAKAARFERLVSAAVRTDWVVYAKPPFGGPAQVLRYLARYTHRAAISDSRLLDFADGVVQFRYKDSAHGNEERVMRLSAREFVRRFVRHVLPRGFVRIRHYGILSNRHRHEELALCRRLLEQAPCGDGEAGPAEEVKRSEPSASVTPTRVCPRCGAGRMRVLETLPASVVSVGEEPKVSVAPEST